MTVERNKSWKKANILKIIQSVAGNSNLKVVYDTSYNPIIEFAEQNNSDLKFLNDLCTKNGLDLIIYSNKLVIFREKSMKRKKRLQYKEKRFIKLASKNYIH